MEPRCESATACCARFYEQDSVQALLGASFHPGGTGLSARLVRSLHLPPGARVLDVACGIGTTTLLMARRFGLDTVGLDISESNLARARAATAANPPVPVVFIAGSAEQLPFAEESFEAVVCECVVSTFPDQPRVLAELARVLRPGGVVGMSDIIVEGILPDDITGLITPWTCLAAARSVVENQSLFLDAGLRVTAYADESAALRDMVVDLKRKLLTAGLARSLGAIPGLEQLDVRGLLDLLRRAEEIVAAGTIQYSRMTFSKGRPRFLPAPTTPQPDLVACDPSAGCC